MGFRLPKWVLILSLLPSAFAHTVGADDHQTLRDELRAEMAKRTTDPECDSKIKSGQSPDNEFSLFPPSLSAITNVVFHDFKSTSGLQNAGIISYMRALVLSDDDFFESAYIFLRRMKQLDSAGRKCAAGGIECKAGNMLSIALDASSGNRYQALQLLALYGHDNVANRLRSYDKNLPSCRLAVLDRLGAGLTLRSSLYLNGAIPMLQYTPEQIEGGKAVATRCAQIRLSAQKLCNDSQPEYQSDYYHVITAAFLGCRAARAKDPILESWLYTTVRSTYLDQVRSYKLDRFAEETSDTLYTLDLSRDFVRALREGLVRLRDGKPPLTEEILQKFSDEDREALSAIFQRYSFEIKFRVSQHRMGYDWGSKYCATEGTPPGACP